MSAAGLVAGAAAVDITPPPGTHLAGDGMGQHRPAGAVLDPLYAKALVLGCGETRVALVVLDLLAVTRPWTERIRAGAARLGFAAEAVIVHATQNHSSPSLGRMMLDEDFPLALTPATEHLSGAEEAYCQRAVDGALAALQQACSRLRPATLGHGTGSEGRLAHNRRGIRKDGTIAMPWFFSRQQQPLGPTSLRCLEGPMDPEVGLAALRGDDGTPLALLLHYSCHPVHAFAAPGLRTAVTADWPGAWAAGLSGLLGTTCPALVLNGCCGNLNPWPPYEADYQPDHRRMGAQLAELARHIYGGVQCRPVTTLAWRHRVVELDYRTVPPARLAEVERILAADPQPRFRPDGQVAGDWFLAASTRSIALSQRREPRFPYQIQAVRVGDLAIVSLPGEPFVEGQLALKLRSPAPLTLVAHMCTQYVGYLPTREAATRGGHEANPECTFWAKFAPDSLDRVVDAAAGLLAELFA
jgi:hypothetical protein